MNSVYSRSKCCVGCINVDGIASDSDRLSHLPNFQLHIHANILCDRNEYSGLFERFESTGLNGYRVGANGQQWKQVRSFRSGHSSRGKARIGIGGSHRC